ncbi:MAG: alkaline shock response membrane anchor protein AmaP [Clostridiales bacterium]|nr:alkaline shock response membrane anchor protein AmaP [Clostridiales bacterium]
MNRIIRFVLIVYSTILAIISLLLLYAFVDDGIFADMLSPLSNIVMDPYKKFVYLAILLALLISCVITVTYCILNGRLSKTRIRQTEIGFVEIGVDAIESIALNSAKSAQAGIKTARARVFSAKNNAIRVSLSAVLYSNVEVPSTMGKVQERVKKDIERYTGIMVENVSVKVSRVEPVVAKVER